MNEITESEWIAELQKHLTKEAGDTEGFTTDEWGEKLGISQRKSQELMKRMVKSGKLVLAMRFVTNDWDGRSRYYRVYRPK